MRETIKRVNGMKAIRKELGVGGGWAIPGKRYVITDTPLPAAGENIMTCGVLVKLIFWPHTKSLVLAKITPFFLFNLSKQAFCSMVHY